jgi:UDP-N-acetylglucosamine 2-epimerase (non-hydrolysing)
MKVVSVVGARPQFVKLAPISEAFTHAGVDHVIVHTGQHYDANMSDVFFADLAIPAPDVNLEIGSGSHGAQTGAMLTALDPVLEAQAPDWVLVYGDTNSTLAGTLSAVKLHIPVAHLEAGLRSFNRRMPEEHNRVLTDHAADLLLAPTQTAMDHLASEGLAERSVLVGDVMADVCLRVAAAVADQPQPLADLGLAPGEFVVATIHRAENTDDPRRLADIVTALRGLPLPTVLLAHPRLRSLASAYGIPLAGGLLQTVEPQPYPTMVALVARARAVVTDSGGLQKEAYLLGTTCTTLRTETEWVETLHGGWNELRPELDGLAESVLRAMQQPQEHPFGHGQAAEQVASALNEGLAALYQHRASRHIVGAENGSETEG